MKRSKRKICFRYFCVSSGVLVGLAVLAVAGMFFVFGSDAMDVLGIGEDSHEASSRDEAVVAINIEQGEAEDLGDASGGSSGGGSSGSGGSGGENSVCSEWSPVQYSFGDFEENVECLVYGVGVCDRVKMTCSTQVFNLDYDAGGIFGVRFSLLSGDEIISYEVLEEEVLAREEVLVVSEIVVDGEFDVNDISCVIDTSSVPDRCVNWS